MLPGKCIPNVAAHGVGEFVWSPLAPPLHIPRRPEKQATNYPISIHSRSFAQAV